MKREKPVAAGGLSDTVLIGSRLQAGAPAVVEPKIANIVATTFIGVKEIPLIHIAKMSRNSTYNPKRFPGIAIRINAPVKATGLVYKSGNMVILGTKTEE